jgi:hypothetical protein
LACGSSSGRTRTLPGAHTCDRWIGRYVSLNAPIN